MSLEGIVIGIVALLVGAALTFAGYRFFLILLPIFGFVAGFYVGSAAVTALFGDGFLSTVTGWLVGLVGGVAFAVLSYLFYYVGVVILAAAVGASIGSGVMAWLGFDPGLLTLIVAAAAAIVVAVAAMILAVPKYLVIVLTAVAGASTLIGGVLLIVGVLKPGDLHDGAVAAEIRQSLLWLVVAIVVTLAGIGTQVRTARFYVLDPEGSRLG